MRFYLIDLTDDKGVQLRMWLKTQDDARGANRELGRKPGDFETVDIPTDKDGLADWLNTYARGRPEPFHALARQVERPSPPPVEPVAIASEPADLVDMVPVRVDAADITTVVDAILASTGQPFGRFLRAAVRRLGELGQRGRQMVEGGFDMNTPGATFSRGAALVGAMTLCEIAGRKPSEAPAPGQEGAGQ